MDCLSSSITMNVLFYGNWSFDNPYYNNSQKEKLHFTARVTQYRLDSLSLRIKQVLIQCTNWFD